MLIYLIRKSNYVRQGIVLGILFSLVLPFTYYGPTNGIFLFEEFYGGLTRFHETNDLIEKREILCLPSLLVRLFPDRAGNFSFALQLQKLITLVLSLVYFFSVWASRQGLLKNSRLAVHLWALGLGLMTFLNPSTRAHYFIFLIPGFCSLIELASKIQQRLWQGFLAIAAFLSMGLLALTTDAIIGKHWNNEFEMWSIPTYGMILLCLFLSAGIWRNRLSFRTE
jgi:hypothetical protein